MIFSFRLIDTEETTSVITNFWSLVKPVKSVIVKPLILIMNQLLSTRIFPYAMKLSKVPLFKKNDTNDQFHF